MVTIDDHAEAPMGISEGGTVILPAEEQLQVYAFLAKKVRDVRPYDNHAGKYGVSEGGQTRLPDAEQAEVYADMAKKYKKEAVPKKPVQREYLFNTEMPGF